MATRVTLSAAPYIPTDLPLTLWGSRGRLRPDPLRNGLGRTLYSQGYAGGVHILHSLVVGYVPRQEPISRTCGLGAVNAVVVCRCVCTQTKMRD